MPIGPRLDRPSAVGDEGRARETSLAVSTALVVGVALLLGYVGGLSGPLRTLALGVGLVGAGMALFQRDTVNAYFFGHVCFLPGGLLTLVGIGMTLVASGAGPGRAVVVVGLAVALLGTAGGWANAVSEGSLKRAAKQGWGALIAPVVLLSVVGGLAFGAIFWFEAVGYALVPQRGPSLSGLALVVGLTSLAIRAALPRLPFRQLAPRDRRPAVAAALDTWRSRARLGVFGGFGGWVGIGILEVAGVVTPFYAAIPGPIAAALASPFLRFPILVAGLLALSAAAVAWIARRLARGFGPDDAGRLGPVFGCLVVLCIALPLVTAALVATDGVGGGRSVVGLLGLALGLVLLGLATFLLVFSIAPILTALGLLPDRAGAPALTSGGLLVATLGAGLAGASAPLVFATAAAALLVWDVSEFGTGLTAELGHVPETRRLELLHGVLSVAVAVVAVLSLVGVWFVVRSVAPRVPALEALVLAVGGVLALLVPLRG